MLGVDKMKKIITILFLAFSSILLAGCENQYKENALIDDVVDGTKTGYKLVKVDGQEVKRIESKIITRIPFAILKEGTHNLLFEIRRDDVPGQKNISLSASLQARKMYRLEINEDKFKLVIDKTY